MGTSKAQFTTTTIACAITGILLVGAAMRAYGGDLRLSLPRQSHLTPVQRLNREGVKEVRRGRVAKAKDRFVKAYLLDPDDPFTLNNLGYIAELEGDADRALKYYKLAAQTSTEAVIDEASAPDLKGRPIDAVFQSQPESGTSRQANFRAIDLLEKRRVFEAERTLRRALQSDPKNPFLLDSLGYVMESEGDLESALRYYKQAADLQSDERVFLTPAKKWRGKTISEVAAHNAALVREVLLKGEDRDARIARLNLRGVVALNHSDPDDAQRYFTDAYRIDPKNAFTLNNIGYTNELEGDRESAEMYYESARTGEESGERATYASRVEAEGRRIGDLAGTNENDVQDVLKQIQAEKRRTRHPVRLLVRGSMNPASEQNPEPASKPAVQPPLNVPTPPLPPPKLPERDLNPPITEPPTEPQAGSLPLRPQFPVAPRAISVEKTVQ